MAKKAKDSTKVIRKTVERLPVQLTEVERLEFADRLAHCEAELAEHNSAAPPWQILHGDCLAVLKTLGTNSIDAVVTDPPYGLSFMGKHWDYDVPKAEVWAEVLRVLKPGGHLLSFFGSRTYHRGVVQIEDAGFEVRDALQWIYGSGFPKSLNIGKAIDAAAGAEREKVGREVYRKNSTAHASDHLRQFGAAEGKMGRAWDITAPATPEAAQWEGFGTALKPAHEPIVLARKPLIGTVAANVLAHGTGGLNIDGCRIGTADDLNGGAYRGDRKGSGMFSGLAGTGEAYNAPSGRWPANVCLDEEAAAMLDAQSGELTRGHVPERSSPSRIYGKLGGHEAKERDMGSGGASRFFYTAKASRDERDGGLELLPAATGGEATSREDGSAGLNSPRAGAGRTGGARNTHPTVKPVSLMRWLVLLVTPPGGLVLDPFAGSASTGVAALHEGLRFLGIELEAEYIEMARERLTAWAAVHEQHTTIKARASGQMPLFAKANP